MKDSVKIPYKKLLMIQVVLTPESRSRLLNAFPPMHGKTFAHHITVAFKPSMEQAQSLAASCGEPIDFTVVAEVSDEKGQAALVSGIDSNNDMPHVTISCADGTKPVYSNELLTNTPSHDFVKSNLSLQGVLTFVTKSQKAYQLPVVVTDGK